MDVADPIPPSVLALMGLFANELQEVSFPGVDRATLEEVITEVRAHTAAVAKAEAALEAARAALRDSEEALSTKTQKALAYARVYAEGRPEIVAKVESVARIAGATSSPPSPARERDTNGAEPKRRGRPKRVAAEPAEATPAAPAVAPVDGDEVIELNGSGPAHAS